MNNIRLADRKECTGCSACVSICPKNCLHMIQDAYGFFFPDICDDQKCIDCNQCQEVCPVINDTIKKKEYGIASYAAFSKNISLRESSSSGGLFSELATNFIKNGGIVYGATFDSNWTVAHKAINTVHQLHEARTAKYSQSDLRNTFVEIKENLKNDKSVLFVGCPCQVAGLKSFLKQSYEKLICIDFVCHGIPSPGVWEEYVKYRASKDNNGRLPVAINLRSKESGWSRYQYSVHFKYDNEIEYNCLSGLDPFMKLFTQDFINRESCGTCKFKGDYRCSDITLGDFWGIWDIDSSMDDNKGTSMVIINTPAGKSLFDFLAEQLITKAVSLTDCSLQNPSLICPAKPNNNRNNALKQIITSGFTNYNAIHSNKGITLKDVLKKMNRKIFKQNNN